MLRLIGMQHDTDQYRWHVVTMQPQPCLLGSVMNPDCVAQTLLAWTFSVCQLLLPGQHETVTLLNIFAWAACKSASWQGLAATNEEACVSKILLPGQQEGWDTSQHTSK